jgi:hypothetical protein
MEHVMQTDTIRRRRSGTVDIDRCRQEALTRRAQMGTRFFRGLGHIARPVIGTVAIIVAYISALHLISQGSVAAEVPLAIAAPGGEVQITTAHAVGAQVYECKVDSAGKLAWQFREPIATLFIAGKTVGRHYAGPSWEMTDGSAVTGKVAAQAPGAGPDDIPLLKLEGASWRGMGQLSTITTIQRLNTRGGRVDAACDSAGTFLSVPYTADYAFYRKTTDLFPRQTH